MNQKIKRNYINWKIGLLVLLLGIIFFIIMTPSNKSRTPSIFKPYTNHICIDKDGNKHLLEISHDMYNVKFRKNIYLFKYGLSIDPDISGYEGFINNENYTGSQIRLYLFRTSNRMNKGGTLSGRKDGINYECFQA